MGRCLGGGKGRGRKRGEGVFLLVFTYLAVVFVIVGKIDLHRLRRRLCPPCRICSRGWKVIFVTVGGEIDISRPACAKIYPEVGEPSSSSSSSSESRISPFSGKEAP